MDENELIECQFDINHDKLEQNEENTLTFLESLYVDPSSEKSLDASQFEKDAVLKLFYTYYCLEDWNWKAWTLSIIMVVWKYVLSNVPAYRCGQGTWRATTDMIVEPLSMNYINVSWALRHGTAEEFQRTFPLVR